MRFDILIMVALQKKHLKCDCTTSIDNVWYIKS